LQRRIDGVVRMSPSLHDDPVALLLVASQPIPDDALFGSLAQATAGVNATQQAAILKAISNRTDAANRFNAYTTDQQNAIRAAGYTPPPQPAKQGWWANWFGQLQQPWRDPKWRWTPSKDDLRHIGNPVQVVSADGRVVAASTNIEGDRHW
jgi:hypothetical protein